MGWYRGNDEKPIFCLIPRASAQVLVPERAWLQPRARGLVSLALQALRRPLELVPGLGLAWLQLRARGLFSLARQALRRPSELVLGLGLA